MRVFTANNRLAGIIVGMCLALVACSGVRQGDSYSIIPLPNEIEERQGSVVLSGEVKVSLPENERARGVYDFKPPACVQKGGQQQDKDDPDIFYPEPEPVIRGVIGIKFKAQKAFLTDCAEWEDERFEKDNADIRKLLQRPVHQHAVELFIARHFDAVAS